MNAVPATPAHAVRRGASSHWHGLESTSDLVVTHGSNGPLGPHSTRTAGGLSVRDSAMNLRPFSQLARIGLETVVALDMLLGSVSRGVRLARRM